MIEVRTTTDSRGITCCVVLRDAWVLIVLAVVRSEMPRCCSSRQVYFGFDRNDAQTGALIHAHQVRCERGPG